MVTSISEIKFKIVQVSLNFIQDFYPLFFDDNQNYSFGWIFIITAAQ